MEDGKFSVTPEDLSKIGGIATVSLLHSFIPTHWLPFSIVGCVQKWTFFLVLSVSAFGAALHVLSTSLLGVTAITITNTIAGEETAHNCTSSHPFCSFFWVLVMSYCFYLERAVTVIPTNKPMEKNGRSWS